MEGRGELECGCACGCGLGAGWEGMHGLHACGAAAGRGAGQGAGGLWGGAVSGVLGCVLLACAGKGSDWTGWVGAFGAWAWGGGGQGRAGGEQGPWVRAGWFLCACFYIEGRRDRSVQVVACDWVQTDARGSGVLVFRGKQFSERRTTLRCHRPLSFSPRPSPGSLSCYPLYVLTPFTLLWRSSRIPPDDPHPQTIRLFPLLYQPSLLLPPCALFPADHLHGRRGLRAALLGAHAVHPHPERRPGVPPQRLHAAKRHAGAHAGADPRGKGRDGMRLLCIRTCVG